MSIEYTKYQFAAIKSHGPVIISAGPGAGKTRVMIARVLRLMKDGIPADEIFATTFTKKAANEFSERIQAANPEHGHKVHVSTIHSLALRILRESGCKVKIAEQFQLLNWARKHNADEPDDVLNRVSRARVANVGSDKDKKLAEKYAAFLKENNVTDMDGIILMVKPLIHKWAKNHPIKAFIVDEFQDTDPSQWHMIKTLVNETNADFCAVGDQDQSIYGFRGAMPQVFNFAKSDLNAKHLFLADCFRCRPHIVTAATNTLAPSASKRTIISHRQQTEKNITQIIAANAVQQGQKIAEQIHDYIEQGIPTNEIAVLGRTRDSLAVLTMTLKAANLPINAESWQNPFNTKTRRIVLGMIRLMANSISKDTLVKHADKLGFTIKASALNNLLKLKNNSFLDFEKEALSFFRGWQKQSAIHALEVAREAFTGNWEQLEKRCLMMRDNFERNNHGITIATAHASKGREWKAVIVAGCDNNNFPHPQAHHEHEERRILFVAMTRAKDHLTIATPKMSFSDFIKNQSNTNNQSTNQTKTLEEKGMLHSIFKLININS